MHGFVRVVIVILKKIRKGCRKMDKKALIDILKRYKAENIDRYAPGGGCRCGPDNYCYCSDMESDSTGDWIDYGHYSKFIKLIPDLIKELKNNG